MITLSFFKKMNQEWNSEFFVFCFVLFCFLLFRAVPTTSGSSQARGWIGATAAGLHHSQHPSQVCNLHHSSHGDPQQCWIPHPLSKARDQTCVFTDTSRIRFHCTTIGTPSWLFLNKCKTKKSKHNAGVVKTQENDDLKGQVQKYAVTRAGRNMTLVRSTRWPRWLYSNLFLTVTLRLQSWKQRPREEK